MKNKKSKSNFFKKILAKKSGKIVLVVISVLLVISIVICLMFNFSAKVDTEYLNALVKKSSELTTAKLKYTGMTEYTDEGLPIFNRADFVMVYTATIRAGINVDEVIVTADDPNKIIYIEIPEATIQDVNIDTSTIKYYDQGFALFNADEKEDNNKAVAMAEEAAKKEAASMGVLELANEQSETLIKGILANAIPDGYTIKAK